jgi:hypothetical protein
VTKFILKHIISTYKEAKKKDYQAQFVIHRCVDATNFEKTASTKTSKLVWDILETSHAGDGKLKKVRL